MTGVQKRALRKIKASDNKVH